MALVVITIPGLGEVDGRGSSKFGESASAGGTPHGHLTEVVKFYREGLGFEVLYEFNDHKGFDGIMLGRI